MIPHDRINGLEIALAVHNIGFQITQKLTITEIKPVLNTFLQEYLETFIGSPTFCVLQFL